MTRSPEIWDFIRNNLPKGKWFSLKEIYRLIKTNIDLDEDDYEGQSPNSNIPKWKRKVGNVLQHRKKTGEIKWDGQGKY